MMKHRPVTNLFRLGAIASVLGTSTVGAAQQDAARQDLAVVKQTVEQFLLTQSAGYPGEVKVSANSVDPNLKLASCAAPEAFLPPGSRPWGKTSVGVRCTQQAKWTIYVQAEVSISGQYLVAATPLPQGRALTESDFVYERGDLTKLPPGVFTEGSQAVGRIVSISLAAGTVLRQEVLRATPAVQQGQKVVLVSKGKGFSISAEGQAMANASEGQLVQVKAASGQMVSGVARSGGQIDVVF